MGPVRLPSQIAGKNHEDIGVVGTANGWLGGGAPPAFQDKDGTYHWCQPEEGSQEGLHKG